MLSAYLISLLFLYVGPLISASKVEYGVPLQNITANITHWRSLNFKSSDHQLYMFGLGETSLLLSTLDLDFNNSAVTFNYTIIELGSKPSNLYVTGCSETRMCVLFILKSNIVFYTVKTNLEYSNFRNWSIGADVQYFDFSSRVYLYLWIINTSENKINADWYSIDFYDDSKSGRLQRLNLTTLPGSLAVARAPIPGLYEFVSIPQENMVKIYEKDPTSNEGYVPKYTLISSGVTEAFAFYFGDSAFLWINGRNRSICQLKGGWDRIIISDITNFNTDSINRWLPISEIYTTYDKLLSGILLLVERSPQNSTQKFVTVEALQYDGRNIFSQYKEIRCEYFGGVSRSNINNCQIDQEGNIDISAVSLITRLLSEPSLLLMVPWKNGTSNIIKVYFGPPSSNNEITLTVL